MEPGSFADERRYVLALERGRRWVGGRGVLGGKGWFFDGWILVMVLSPEASLTTVA